MPDQTDIETVLLKIEQLFESRNSTEKLLVSIDERLKTIVARGCQQGENMNKDLRKELYIEIEKTNKRINSMQKLYNKIAALTTMAGMAIGYWFKTS
jgi:hypothetical protein